MKKIVYLLLLTVLLVSPVLGAETDKFILADTIDRIDRIPRETVKLCKVEVDQGVQVLGERIETAMQGFPVLIGVSSASGMIIGVFIGNFVSLFLQRHMRLRNLKLLSEIKKEIKSLNINVEGLKVKK